MLNNEHRLVHNALLGKYLSRHNVLVLAHTQGSGLCISSVFSACEFDSIESCFTFKGILSNSLDLW